MNEKLLGRTTWNFILLATCFSVRVNKICGDSLDLGISSSSSNTNLAVVSKCVDLCVADDYSERSNLVKHENINVNLTVIDKEQIGLFSTNEIYNLQVVSTQFFHEQAIINELKHDYRILNTFLLVKDQLQVLVPSSGSDGEGEEALLLISTIYLSHIGPSSISSASLKDEIHLEEELYFENLKKHNILSNSSYLAISFDDSDLPAYQIIIMNNNTSTLTSSAILSNTTSTSTIAIDVTWYVITISALSSMVFFLMLSLAYTNKIFESWSCNFRSSKSYDDGDDYSSKSFEDEPTIKTASPPTEDGQHINNHGTIGTWEAFHDEPLPKNDFKITPLRGIYRNHDFDISRISEDDFEDHYHNSIISSSAGPLGIASMRQLSNDDDIEQSSTSLSEEDGKGKSYDFSDVSTIQHEDGNSHVTPTIC